MKKQIIVIHGGETFDSYDKYIEYLKNFEMEFERISSKLWKDTLAPELGDNYEIISPRMPNSLNAKYLEWKIWFDKLTPFFNPEVVLIGNSLGGIFLAKYLSENVLPKKIIGTFLVAAPYDAEGTDYSLADFVLQDDLSLLQKQSGVLHLYQSKDDPIVPPQNVEKYRAKLPQAVITLLDGRGHFFQETFPEIIADIRKLSW